MTHPCDRCGAAGETALDLGCFSYLCPSCWGEGRHACGQCEEHLHCCDRCRDDLAPSDQRAAS